MTLSIIGGDAGYREEGASHFRLKVVSEQFEGLSRVQRHRLIYEALAEPIAEQIHALAIVAQTPHEAAQPGC